MDYVFDWSKDIGKLIDYDINDDFIINMKNNSNKYDSLAIIVMGQLRSFPELFENFKILIERLKLVFPKVVIFFYISTDVSYVWRYHKDKDTINYLKCKYNFSLDSFKNLVKDIKCEHIIKEKKENKHNSSYLSQLYDINLCHLDIYDYEYKNNIKFNYILKTRPDILLKDEHVNYDFKQIFINHTFFLNWDVVYTYPRDFSIIFDQFINNIKTNSSIKEVTSPYIKSLPEEIINNDIKILIEHFIFLISTQYLKIIKYKKITIFKMDKADMG